MVLADKHPDDYRQIAHTLELIRRYPRPRPRTECLMSSPLDELQALTDEQLQALFADIAAGGDVNDPDTAVALFSLALALTQMVQDG
jgi:hypothetical protein